MFLDAVDASLDAGVEFDEAGLADAMKDFELAWWAERPGSFPDTPDGDPKAAVAKSLAGL